MHGADTDELLSNADLALYLAKKGGGRVYRYFTPSLRATAQSRRALARELHRAFANGEFERILHLRQVIEQQAQAGLG
jgi:predicted signal transduction protein with EAL and GGDEF domain